MSAPRVAFTPVQRRRLVTLAITAAVVFVLLGALVHTDPVFSIDRGTQHLIQAERAPAFEHAMRFVTHLGSGWVLAPATALLCLVLASRHRPLATTFAGTAVAAVVLEKVMKAVVDRARPNSDAWGYPSGHVLGTLVLCGMLVYALWALGVPRRWCAGGATVAAVVVAGVALSRLWINVHWLSDVVGGIAGGTALVVTVALAIDARARADTRADVDASSRAARV